MNKRSSTQSVRSIIITISTMVVLSACNLHSIRPGHILKKLPAPPILVPHGVVHIPTRSRREHHNYQYYPGSQVYFDVDTNMYFYHSRNSWITSDSLPASIHLNQENWVHIRMGSSTPYSRHQHHKRKYPHGWVKSRQKHKKKHKKKHH